MTPRKHTDNGYIQEIPSGARAIEAVDTSVASFIGFSEKGPADEPVRVFSFSQFEYEFGGTSGSDMAYAVAHFFLCGGSTAWIVRVVETGDESTPTANDFIGSQAGGTGMYALDGVDLINLLVIPGATTPAAHNAMVAYAEQRRAFAVLDLPGDVASLDQAQSWIAAAPKSANAAAYFPRLLFPDPANSGQPRALSNSGAVAGVYARTDAQRGVWKAPAGHDSSISGAVGVETPLNDAENGVLNSLGLNALRGFPGPGLVVWGARTLVGADSMASQWKYVPVRRTALMIEESLYRGLQWVVFEPNDAPLWSQIRLSVGPFLQSLFRQGAFQGASPKDAYFVKCDAGTTSAADVAVGIVNLYVGFAPLKPAEFVVLKLSLLTKTIKFNLPTIRGNAGKHIPILTQPTDQGSAPIRAASTRP